MTTYTWSLNIDQADGIRSISVGNNHVFTADVEVDGDLRKDVTFSLDDQTEIPGSRGVANLVIGQGRLSIKPLTSTSTFGMWTAGTCIMAKFDCRHLKIVKIKLRDGFVVTSASGMEWKNADLSTSWTEFDEKSNECLFIDSVKSILEPF